MNRLTAPRAEPRVADEQQGLAREPHKADLAQQQRFEQALRLESAQQKRARDHKALTGNPIGKRDEHRRTKPDAPLAGNKVADKEKELVERRLTRPAPRSKNQHDKQEGNERQESQTLPATLPLIREGMQAPTLQQDHEQQAATEHASHDKNGEAVFVLPASSLSTSIASDGELTGLNQDAMQESGELGALLEVGERLQIVDEPTEQRPATSEEELLAQESFASSAIRVPPLSATPGDLLLARVAPRVDHHELGQLLSRLAVDIHLELGRPERPPMLQLTLPALGALAIRIEHHQGSLQVEMLASEQGSQLLNQGRGELIDRLQRLYPGERVAFDLFTRGDSEQGSRQKRSIYDEWDADA
ncbi:type III secretion system needle length determinant [Aeromonas jandaei]|uniref:type III secretion system needle length determinant n=1 Tax=Aeromonas jandaei TaxID=650 RepID=UPI00227B5BC1|nr:type III secretion system needle length determinant [Aeromonas jandaei]WAG07157.1 type III secretion system needle length determinant [Aeromonas jandaei]